MQLSCCNKQDYKQYNNMKLKLSKNAKTKQKFVEINRKNLQKEKKKIFLKMFENNLSFVA